jgi:hypothetical protein
MLFKTDSRAGLNNLSTIEGHKRKVSVILPRESGKKKKYNILAIARNNC